MDVSSIIRPAVEERDFQYSAWICTKRRKPGSGAFRCTCFFSLPSCNFLCGLLVGMVLVLFFYFYLVALVRLGSCFSSTLIVYGVGALFYPVYSLLGGGHLCFVGAALHARACCVALSCVILLRPFTSFTIRYPPLRTRFAAADRDSSTSSVVFCAVFLSGGVFSSCLFLLPFALFFFRLGDTKDVHDRLSALSLALEEGGEVAR